jgi:hypothetical protein
MPSLASAAHNFVIAKLLDLMGGEASQPELTCPQLLRSACERWVLLPLQ